MHHRAEVNIGAGSGGNGPTYGPHNPHPLSQMRTELVWEGKYDEYGNRREVDVAGLAMPLQKIETIDQPRSEAAAAGQLDMFDKQAVRRDDFRNRLIWGDNKLVMASLLKEFKGKIDLIYIDPPFDVGADFTMQVAVGDEKETIEKDQSTLEMVAYRDTWGRGADSFIAMIYDRLVLARELLAETGSIYVHCDPRVNSLIRSCMDEVFGKENHLSEIVWKRTSARSDAVFWGPIHDTMYFYSKSSSYTWKEVYQKYDDAYLESKYTGSDARGRYRTDNLTAAGLRGGDSGKPWRGIDPAQIGGHWKVNREAVISLVGVEKAAGLTTQQKLDLLDKNDYIYWPAKEGGRPQFKKYMGTGVAIQDIVLDIPPVNSQAEERVDYPTQKPEALLNRIIEASSNEGDLVADMFCGCGTTGAASERLGRRWLMCDLGRFAVHTTRKRLIDLQRNLHAEGQPYRAFDVYNLGRYERQWWQKERLKGADDEHRRVVLEFFRAEQLTKAPSPLIHGRKAGAFCHVDSIDSVFTREEAKALAMAVAQAGGKECYVLAWEFEMDLRLALAALEQELGVKLKPVFIPREIMEKNVKGPVPFFEMAVVEAEAVYRMPNGGAPTPARTPPLRSPGVPGEGVKGVPREGGKGMPGEGVSGAWTLS